MFLKNRQKVFVSLLIIVVMTFGFTLNVFAYSANSIRFASSIISYSYASGTSSFNSAVTDSASSWSSSTDVTLNKYSSGGSIYLVEVNNSAVSWDGISYPGLSTSGNYYSGFGISINKYYTAGYAYNKLRSVVAHEFGHALSLNHSDSKCLMLPTTQIRYDFNRVYYPQSDDINGVNFVY